jgi:septum formation protein
MKKIILASNSKARRLLLKKIGIRFIIEATHVKEEVSLKKGIRFLVLHNAVAKAKAVAKKHKSGIVIGADTMVLASNTLIGKPKHFKDAQRTIKLLTQQPHWVYTGIAVVDVDSGKVYKDWDKTKVWMRCLSDAQIKDYCRKFMPLDYAGGFDIQGPGAGLIARIEGCFYNVVGLPLAKLLRILEKCDIDCYGV